jgi:hypothetical protein
MGVSARPLGEEVEEAEEVGGKKEKQMLLPQGGMSIYRLVLGAPASSRCLALSVGVPTGQIKPLELSHFSSSA